MKMEEKPAQYVFMQLIFIEMASYYNFRFLSSCSFQLKPISTI